MNRLLEQFPSMGALTLTRPLARTSRYRFDDPIDGAPGDSRREFLKLLIAGGIGLMTAAYLPLRRRLEEFNQEEEGPPSTGDNGEGEGGSLGSIYVYQEGDEYRAVNSDGDEIDSGSNGWAVLENGVAAVPDGGSIWVGGQYEGNSTIAVNRSIRMHGEDAFIDFQESGSYVFELSGTERYETSLADGTETGANSLELAETEDMEPGDLVLLEDTESDPLLGRGQPPGESHTISEIDGSSVRLEDSIVWREGYPSGTLAYVIDPIEVVCTGFDLQSPAKDERFYGIAAKNCRNSKFSDLSLRRFGSRGLTIEACGNFRIRDCSIYQSADIEAADGYGIQIRAGCHDVIVEACVAKECRHPLSVTPAGPLEVASRTITFRDCFVTADGSAALNCHGGSAHDVRFEGCMVHTWGQPGVRSGAMKTSVTGCEFRMSEHHAITTRNDAQGMIVTVTDTDIFGAGNAVELASDEDYEFNPRWDHVSLDNVRAYGCNRLFGLESGGVDRVRALSITGCYWDQVTEDGIRFDNRIDGGVIAGNDFGSVPNGSHIRARDESDTAITSLNIVSNRFSKLEGDTPSIRMARSQRCVISDNTFETESAVGIYADGSDATANLIKQNTCYAPGFASDVIDEDAGSLATDNFFYDTQEGEWM